MQAMPDPLRLLAFDFGRKRIGTALGNSLTATATPLQTLTCDYPELPWKEIDELVANWSPDCLLLGMPSPENGKSSGLEKVLRRFAAELQKRYDKPVDFVNEAFTSYEAESRLRQQRQQGRKKKINKSEIDQLAAAVIIETWLEGHSAT